MSIFGGDSDVTLTIKAKDEASAGISSVTSSMAKLTGAFTVGNLAANAIQAGLNSLGNALGNTIKDAIESEQSVAQLNAVLASTKGVAGVTAQSAIDLASSLQLVTTFSDEAVLGAENMLLTFTKISKETFPQATKVALDMSVALGQDLKNSSIQLGKALNDPVQGVSALQRVGVTFSDSQKKVIERLVETGQTLEAQKYILKELTTEFGGSAEAQAKTFGGQIMILKNQVGELSEGIGKVLIGSLTQLNTNGQATSKGIEAITSATRPLQIGFYMAAQTALILANGLNVVGKGLALSINDLMDWSKVVANSVGVINDIGNKNFSGIGEKIKGIFDPLTSDESKARNKDLGAQFDGAVKSFTDSGSRLINAGANVDSIMAGFNKTINTAYAGGGAAADTAAKKTKDLSEHYKKLGEALAKVRQTAADDLASIKKSHDDTVKSSTDRINELKKSLRELSDSYNQAGADAQASFAKQQKNDAKNIGEQIVAEQQKIADLKRQAGTEKDPQKRIDIETQLKQEQDAYNANADFIKSMGVEVVEAQRRAGLTDFQRAIEDYKAKRDLAQAEFDDNRNRAAAEYAAKAQEIKLQIVQEKKKIEDANTAYNLAQTSITKILADAEAMRLSITKKTADETIKLVDAQIEKYNRLADAIARATQGKGAQISVSSAVPITREHGGIVPGAVGEAVPILAHGQERVIPAGQSYGSDGGGNYNITINNPVVRNDADLNAMRQAIEDALRDVSRVHKLTTI